MAQTGLYHTSQLTVEPLPKDNWTLEPLDIPSTLQECITQLNEARREVKTIVKNSFAQRDCEQCDRIRDLDESTSPIYILCFLMMNPSSMTSEACC